jgi:cytochrome c oxidase subunit 2
MTAAGLALAVLLLAGCGGPAALAAAGPQAGRIAGLWAVVFWIAVIVETAVVAFMLYAVARSRRPGHDPAGARPEAGREHRAVVAITVAVGLTAATVLGLLVASIGTDRALASLTRSAPLTVEVTGQQWWWDIEYDDPVPSQRVRTANELHLPVGEPVLLTLRSRDVIHSVWVPQLHGKQDLIPGRTTSLWIQADRPGTFTGQCAEFCGYQHAHMRLLVVAESRATFDAWRAQQRQPATEPTDPLVQRGRAVFLAGPCVLCHAIGGTRAGARVGPDLTHLAGRATIAGGTLPNTPGHLAGWILDPQRIKPGAHMPAMSLPAHDLQALLAYLAALR